MAIILSDLIKDVRWVNFPYAGQELNIAYRPNAINLETQAMLTGLVGGDIEELANVLPIMVAEWDLYEDDGVTQVPPTNETFRRLSFPLLQAITQTITDDMLTEQEKKISSKTSADSLPPAGRSENAPTGIPSSELADTWA